MYDAKQGYFKSNGDKRFAGFDRKECFDSKRRGQKSKL